MLKSFTSIWLRGFRSLLKIQRDHVRQLEKSHKASSGTAGRKPRVTTTTVGSTRGGASAATSTRRATGLVNRQTALTGSTLGSTPMEGSAARSTATAATRAKLPQKRSTRKPSVAKPPVVKSAAKSRATATGMRSATSARETTSNAVGRGSTLLARKLIGTAQVPHSAVSGSRSLVGTRALRATSPAARSRVGPRPAAWALGKWTRSFFSAPPAAGELVNHLQYGLYLPPGPHSRALPLVVMLHGCKQNIEEFAQGTRMNLLADRHGFAVLYPEQSNHAHPHRCWRWYDESPRAGGKEAGSITALVRAMVAQHGFDATRVYAAGLSAGAGMTAMLAVRYPTLFAAVALHSGVAFGEANTAVGAMDVMRRGVRHDPVALLAGALDADAHPGMPAMILHGDADSVVSPANADQLELQFLRLNGALDGDGELTPGVHIDSASVGANRAAAVNVPSLDAAGNEIGLSPAAAIRAKRLPIRGELRDFMFGDRLVVRSCRVAGLAHAWSGGDDAFAFHASKGPNASALIWDFFRQHSRPDALRFHSQTHDSLSGPARRSATESAAT
jgi:poly(hydroxyalkanoate) depolymerase family esterase